MSVKYQRRHFRETAAMIKDMPKATRAKWAAQWSTKFAADNPQFDKAKFIKACGL